MLQLSDKVLREIAGELDMGMKCFYHLHTGELVSSIPDEVQFGDLLDDGVWDADIKRVEGNPDDYLAFTPMESRESYEVMQDFVLAIPNERLRDRFEAVIQSRKPFQQFKNLLLDYSDLRQEWFTFKEQRYIEYVRAQLGQYNRRSTMGDDE